MKMNLSFPAINRSSINWPDINSPGIWATRNMALLSVAAFAISLSLTMAAINGYWLWLVAALGLGLGAGSYALVGLSVVVLLLVLLIFPSIERRIDAIRETHVYDRACQCS